MNQLPLKKMGDLTPQIHTVRRAFHQWIVLAVNIESWRSLKSHMGTLW